MSESNNEAEQQNQEPQGAVEVAESPVEVPTVDVSATEDGGEEGGPKKNRLMVPIVFKQFIICIVLILAAVIPISHQSTKMFSDLSQSRARDELLDQVTTRAVALQRELENTIEKVKLLSNIKLENMKDEKKKGNSEQMMHVFKQIEGLISIQFLTKKDDIVETIEHIVDVEYLKQFKLNKEYIEHVRKQINFPIEAIFASTPDQPILEIRNSSTENGIPMVTIGLPFVTDEVGTTTHIAVAEFRLDILQKSLNTQDKDIFAVDQTRTILAHPDDKLVLSRKRIEKSELIDQALDSDSRIKSWLFDEGKESYIGAFAKTDFGIVVVSQVAESIILEDARMIRHEAIGIAAMVLSVALFFIAVFAMTLTAPIEKLELFAREISLGNFAAKSEVRSRDEVERLANTMNEMVEGLIERDKAKNLINKFHGAVGAELLKQGDLGRQGSRKDVTVFFSDIRGFTKFSEGHTAEEVVSMLNEYFQVMVKIINDNDGVVDKFIGDAIMAVWGVMSDSNEGKKAVKACVEMRLALAELNKSRKERGLSEILIGAGLHSGEAIAGTIGSDERMEYTVIGDTVNMSARIEASTKAFGADILVSDTLQNQIKDEFWIEEAGTVEVKGKAKPLTLYKVKGIIKDGEKVEISTDYSTYESGAADKVKIAG